MAIYPYRIVNVFTQGDDPFSGNPLCVFENGESLDTARMQALALQFNLSETTFILPSARASAQVRIFTPRYEMSFAGHPTLGTAHVCRALGLATNKLTLEMPAGIIAVTATGRRWTLQANSPTWRVKCKNRDSCLRICSGLMKATSVRGRCGSTQVRSNWLCRLRANPLRGVHRRGLRS